MEALSDSNIENNNEGFFNYVFNFDNDNKAMLSNLFQFAFLSVPLVVIALKTINHFTPEETDEKGTLEISTEIILSLSFILLSIWFINKIVRYIPTYSKKDYIDFNESSFVIPFLILLFTIQTKIGSKINILVERLIDLYEGKTNLKTNEKQSDVKRTQPIARPPGHQVSQADLLPSQNNGNGFTQTQHNNQVQNQNPDFNNMIAGPNTPLVNAQEPMAANESLGGLFGGSTLF